jgi:hypothetical protein
MLATRRDYLAASRALDSVWRQLARAISDAEQTLRDAARDSQLRDDARVRALDRWLFLFASEIERVRTVHDAVEAGARLAPEDIRIAQSTGAKLLELVSPVQAALRNRDTAVAMTQGEPAAQPDRGSGLVLEKPGRGRSS